MPLASGADVKIGAYEFMLAEEGYEHYYENLYGEGGEIEGTEGKKNANKNILFWGYDNFIHGEGLAYYDKDQPARWKSGNNNPRRPGSITSPPTRAQTTKDLGGAFTSGFAQYVSVGGRLWFFARDQGFYSEDSGATWTENTDVATELPASYEIFAACHDGEFPYIAASDGTDRGIWRVDSTTAVSDVVTVHTTDAFPLGLAARDGYLYEWTGGQAFRYKLDTIGGTLPITFSSTTHKISLGGNNSGTADSYEIHADCVTADNAVFFFRAHEGFTQLFEWKRDPQTNKDAGRMFWTLVDGFTGHHFCVSGGVIFIAGDYQGQLALWGYSLVSKQPLFLGFFGEFVHGSTPLVRFVVPSYGAQVLIGTSDTTNNYVWVYDAEEDAFSQLDTRTLAADGGIIDGGGITFRGKRLSMHLKDSDTIAHNSWNMDIETPATTWDWVSSAYDFGYPQDEKVLLGFHVVNDPSISAGTVDLDYQLDEDGNWVDSGTDTAAGSKHTYMQISDGSTTKKFRTLRFRLNGASGARVLAAYARVYINSKQEVWRLKLDLNNEPGTGRHPSNRQANSTKLRNNLHTLVSDGNVVTFLDGRRRVRKSSTSGTGYTSHTVLVEFPKDAADSGREGSVEVILRSVAPSA